MQTIVLANNKGGEGKTTSTLNIGYALVARGHTVLLIDGDEQANLSQSFPYRAPASRTLAAVLLGQIALVDAVEEVAPGLWLLPAGDNLGQAIAKRAEQPGAELALRKLLSGLRLDYCLIDTPGSMGKITDAALTAATAVFIPAQPETYGVSGLVNLVRRCRQIQDVLNPDLRIGGLFFIKYSRVSERRKVLRAMVEALSGHAVLGPLVMFTTVRDSTKVKEAIDQRANLLTYAPEATAALDYVQLTAEILSRLNA